MVRMRDFLLYAIGGCLLATVLASPLVALEIQFGLSELPGDVDPHGDSLVVVIPETETELISHARALVDWVKSGADPMQSPGSTILVTEIALGSDGINRNYLAEGEPLWSWHAVGTPSFADFTIEILDGWPTFVEQDVDAWIANTNGQIGFWGYTVTEEIGPLVPEPASIGLVSSALLFFMFRRKTGL